MRVHIEGEDIVVPSDRVDAYEVIYLNSLLDEFETVDLVISWAPSNISDVSGSPGTSGDKTNNKVSDNDESRLEAKAQAGASLEPEGSDQTQPTQVQARFVGVPYYGESTVIETRRGDALSAIESCFARTRRAILRQHRLAALAS